MSTKDYIKLADALRAAKPRWLASGADVPLLAQWQRDVGAIAGVLIEDNPRFKPSMWIGYVRGECGVRGGKK